MSAPTTTELQVNGMTCNNCARHVTEALQEVAAVRSAQVSLEHKRATVQWASAETMDVPALLKAVAQAGFEAREMAGSESARGDTVVNRWQWNLIIGLGVTGILMAGEWVLGLGETPWFRWLALGLAGIVQVFCGAQFYSGAWRQLKSGHSNMDTLVALGSTTAFGFSAWTLLGGAGGHLFFMEAAAIISLISFGHWLEARVSEKATGALKSLLNLAPQTARKLVPAADQAAPALVPGKLPAFGLGGPQSSPLPRPATIAGGSPGPSLKTLSFSQSAIANRQSPIESEVPVADLRVNDRVALRPGDRVPVDGTVLEGDSAVDEAMLTGEANPVDKKTGSELFAGTVNLNGRLVMRVSATGQATALAQIIAAVQRAQTSRAGIQRLGDRISNVFVPAIVVVALGAGLWWGLAPASAAGVHECLGRFLWHAHVPAGAAAGFIIAAAVLIIACPCAMGLATPAAIMAAANAAARRGFLIRDGVALEKAGRITAVVFDKTGTLTEGKPALAAAKLLPLELPPELKSLKAEELAAPLAALSNHPLSRALASTATARFAIKDFKEQPGRGVSGRFVSSANTTHRLQLGSLHWLREEGVPGEAAEFFSVEWMDRGATVIGLAVDGRLAGVFALRDTLRTPAAGVMERLANPAHGAGYKTYIVSGDSHRTVRAVAEELEIVFSSDGDLARGRAFAEVRPEQKAEFVKQLQARGERVAFVGDGINDAPALTQADLGIAVVRASDIAREAADIVLLNSDIEAVPEALELARRTLRIIKQNLFWAFFYNALGVPLAALGFISPVFCAAAMGGSDLMVIGNALRLLRRKPPR
jgi:Cu+-exporting ATPase